MTDYRSVMQAIAVEFPLPVADRPVGETGTGKWTEDMVEELLEAIEAEHPEFQYRWSSRRQGWQVWCPGNDPEGWEDGEAHGEPYSDINDSTMIFVIDGWASFSCRHAHCGEASEHGKKRFKHFLDYYDPNRELIEYPKETREEYLARLAEDIALMKEMGVEFVNLPPEYTYLLAYKSPKGKIFSNDGIHWVDANGLPIK
jgi:hypothetical protein